MSKEIRRGRLSCRLGKGAQIGGRGGSYYPLRMSAKCPVDTLVELWRAKPVSFLLTTRDTKKAHLLLETENQYAATTAKHL